MNSNLTLTRPNPSTGRQKVLMVDASTQARRISSKTVSDDAKEMYSRMMQEVKYIETLQSQIAIIREDEVSRQRKIKELEKTKRVELHNRTMRVIAEETARVREVERQKWQASIDAKAHAMRKAKRAEIVKEKEREMTKMREAEIAKVKEAEIAKVKEAEKAKEIKKKKAAIKAKLIEKEKVESRKRKGELETKVTEVKTVKFDDWEKDFGFKKPKPKMAKTYKVPGSPLTYYKKPAINRKEVIVISDDDSSSKRTPIFNKLVKAMEPIPTTSRRVVNSKDMEFYKRIVESSSESESESEDEDKDEDNGSDNYDDLEAMEKRVPTDADA